MNSKIKFTFILTVLLITISLSCKKSAAECSADWSSEIESELTAVVNASQAYATNPSAANCTVYKNSYLDYIKALKDLDGCSALTGQNRTEWQKAISDAETAANNITC